MKKGSWHLKSYVENQLKCSKSDKKIDYLPAITFYGDLDIEVELSGKDSSKLELAFKKAEIKIHKFSDSQIGTIRPKDINFQFSVLSGLATTFVNLISGKNIILNDVLKRYLDVTFIKLESLHIAIYDSYTELLVSPQFSFNQNLLDRINEELEQVVKEFFRKHEDFDLQASKNKKQKQMVKNVVNALMTNKVVHYVLKPFLALSADETIFLREYFGISF